MSGVLPPFDTTPEWDNDSRAGRRHTDDHPRPNHETAKRVTEEAVSGADQFPGKEFCSFASGAVEVEIR